MPRTVLKKSHFHHTWRGKKGRHFVFIPISKSFILTFVVQTMTFQAKLPSQYFLNGILRPIFCININTHSVRNEKLCKIYFKNLFFENVFAFIDFFYSIRYFIYSDYIWRHVCTICTEAATGGVLWKKLFLKVLLISQVFSCEISKIFRNIYFEEHLRTTASICNKICKKIIAVFHIEIKLDLMWKRPAGKGCDFSWP